MPGFLAFYDQALSCRGFINGQVHTSSLDTKNVFLKTMGKKGIGEMSQ